MAYDAVVIVSFGGPERRDDVLPFLENVTRGRSVPRERLLEVAAHYDHCGGRSPINDQNRELQTALEAVLLARGPQLPVYWGNRNWHPYLSATLRRMSQAGVRRALAFVTSAFGSFSSCRQYLDDIAAARAATGAAAPEIDKLRLFYNHPDFIAVVAERTRAAFELLAPACRASAHLLFTAHSIPSAMAAVSPYQAQLEAACDLVATALDRRARWRLAYQSRSGPPTQPWLEPDFTASLRAIAAFAAGRGASRDIVAVPIGFLSDHVEVLYDLDVEAAELARSLGLRLLRAGTPGTHPRLIAMIRELIAERVATDVPRRSLGDLGSWPDICPADCCLATP